MTERRLPLTRERVLDGAIELADADGIDGLSMRRLARAVGVEAMSLYYHAENKDDILNGMVEKVVGEIELPRAGSDWQGGLRMSATSAHDVLARHPWACNLLMSPARLGPARLAQMEALLRCLRDGGFSVELTDHAYHALDSHILGFTLWEAGYTSGFRDVPSDYAATLLTRLPRQAYPHLADHMDYHMRPSSGQGSDFSFGLELILGGLERALTATRGDRVE